MLLRARGLVWALEAQDAVPLGLQSRCLRLAGISGVPSRLVVLRPHKSPVELVPFSPHGTAGSVFLQGPAGASSTRWSHGTELLANRPPPGRRSGAQRLVSSRRLSTACLQCFSITSMCKHEITVTNPCPHVTHSS